MYCATPEEDDNIVRFEIARPTESDAHLVMKWCNNPATLSMSYHREPKVWPVFFDEYRRYFSDPRLDPVFVLADGDRAGFLRFEPSVIDASAGVRVACVISVYLAPSFRGRGLGGATLKGAQELLRRRGVDDVYAEIRVENAASCRAFEAAGFERMEEAEKLVEETAERCRIFRYRARLVRDR